MSRITPTRSTELDTSDPEVRLGLRLSLIVIAVVLVAIPFGLLLVEVLSTGPLTRFDERDATNQNAQDLSDRRRVDAAEAVTQLGSTTTLIVVVVVAAVFLLAVRRRRRQAVFLVTTAVLGVATNNIIKVAVGRRRPQFEHRVAHGFGNSFPSGHAMNSTVVYGSLLVVAWVHLRTPVRRLAASVVVVGSVVLVATSHVVLGVHYLSDVLGGIVLGTAFVLASTAAFRAWQHEAEQVPTVSHGTPERAAASDRDTLDHERSALGG